MIIRRVKVPDAPVRSHVVRRDDESVRQGMEMGHFLSSGTGNLKYLDCRIASDNGLIMYGHAGNRVERRTSVDEQQFNPVIPCRADIDTGKTSQVEQPVASGASKARRPESPVFKRLALGRVDLEGDDSVSLGTTCQVEVMVADGCQHVGGIYTSQPQLPTPSGMAYMASR